MTYLIIIPGTTTVCPHCSHQEHHPNGAKIEGPTTQCPNCKKHIELPPTHKTLNHIARRTPYLNGTNNMNKTTAQQLAKTIAKDLFTKWNGDHAKRLVMWAGVPPAHTDQGGWSEPALATQILHHLTQEITPTITILIPQDKLIHNGLYLVLTSKFKMAVYNKDTNTFTGIIHGLSSHHLATEHYTTTEPIQLLAILPDYDNLLYQLQILELNYTHHHNRPRHYGATIATQPVLEKQNQCIASTHNSPWGCHQCDRRRGHGPDQQYCPYHAQQIQNGEIIHTGW